MQLVTAELDLYPRASSSLSLPRWIETCYLDVFSTWDHPTRIAQHTAIPCSVNPPLAQIITILEKNPLAWSVHVFLSRLNDESEHLALSRSNHLLVFKALEAICQPYNIDGVMTASDKRSLWPNRWDLDVNSCRVLFDRLLLFERHSLSLLSEVGFSTLMLSMCASLCLVVFWCGKMFVVSGCIFSPMFSVLLMKSDIIFFSWFSEDDKKSTSSARLKFETQCPCLITISFSLHVFMSSSIAN